MNKQETITTPTTIQELASKADELYTLALKGEALSTAISDTDNLESLTTETIALNIMILGDMFKQLSIGLSGETHPYKVIKSIVN